MRCIVIDDEPVALEKMSNYIGKTPVLQLVALYESVFDAMQVLATEQVDALFLDINMPDINGMEFVSSLPQRPLIVFTTAYSEYAVESYRLSAVDYLLKPFDFVTFQQAVQKLVSQFQQKKSEATAHGHLYVKVDYRYVNLCIADILYVKAMSEYVQVFLDGRKPVMVHTTLRQFNAMLPAHFLQVHRSYIVNMDRVKEIERMRIVIDDGVRIAVSENYKADFQEYLRRHSLS